MQTIALLENNVVKTIALWDGVSEWNPGEQYELVDVTGTRVGSGWTYDGEVFTPPPPAEEL